jgi:hypothetical protein
MAPLPEDRFASVQDVRRAIEAFLEHRASRQLSHKAAKSVKQMDEALAAGDDASAERAFVEATFGYRAALDAWSDNRQAEDALRALIRRRIESALDDGAFETAERLLALAPNLPEAFQVHVREAVAEHERRKRELSRVVADHDRTEGVATRRVLTLIVFGSWVGWWSYAGFEYPMAATDMVVGPAAITVLAALLSYAARDRLRSRQNRNLVVAVLAQMIGTVSWLLAAAQLSIDAASVPLPLPLLWSIATIVGALAIDRRALPAGFVYWIGFHLAAADPTRIQWVLGVTNLFWLLNALVVNVLVTREARGRGSAAAR